MEYYWRLTYPDGRIADEPENTTSIMVCPPGANRIAVCTGPASRRDEVAAMLMGDDRLLGCSRWVPIFYRRRLGGIGIESATIATIFGRGCEGVNECHTTVFMMRGSTPVPVPPALFDYAACQGLIQEGLGVRTR